MAVKKSLSKHPDPFRHQELVCGLAQEQKISQVRQHSVKLLTFGQTWWRSELSVHLKKGWKHSCSLLHAQLAVLSIKRCEFPCVELQTTNELVLQLMNLDLERGLFQLYLNIWCGSAALEATGVTQRWRTYLHICRVCGPEQCPPCWVGSSVRWTAGPRWRHTGVEWCPGQFLCQEGRRNISWSLWDEDVGMCCFFFLCGDSAKILFLSYAPTYTTHTHRFP